MHGCGCDPVLEKEGAIRNQPKADSVQLAPFIYIDSTRTKSRRTLQLVLIQPTHDPLLRLRKSQVLIGADSKAFKRVLDGVSKAAPGLSFMGFSAAGPGASGKLLVFNVVAGAAAEVDFRNRFVVMVTAIRVQDYRFLSARACRL